MSEVSEVPETLPEKSKSSLVSGMSEMLENPSSRIQMSYTWGFQECSSSSGGESKSVRNVTDTLDSSKKSKSAVVVARVGLDMSG